MGKQNGDCFSCLIVFTERVLVIIHVLSKLCSYLCQCRNEPNPKTSRPRSTVPNQNFSRHSIGNLNRSSYNSLTLYNTLQNSGSGTFSRSRSPVGRVQRNSSAIPIRLLRQVETDRQARHEAYFSDKQSEIDDEEADRELDDGPLNFSINSSQTLISDAINPTRKESQISVSTNVSQISGAPDGWREMRLKKTKVKSIDDMMLDHLLMYQRYVKSRLYLKKILRRLRALYCNEWSEDPRNCQCSLLTSFHTLMDRTKNCDVSKLFSYNREDPPRLMLNFPKRYRRIPQSTREMLTYTKNYYNKASSLSYELLRRGEEICHANGRLFKSKRDLRAEIEDYFDEEDDVELLTVQRSIRLLSKNLRRLKEMDQIVRICWEETSQDYDDLKSCLNIIFDQFDSDSL